MEKPIILKVRQSVSGQRVVTIPRDVDIEKDDYIIIKKLQTGNENLKNN